tara:strand:- start:91726 stop:92034 length:309 start_codon:yes stop_codon:yes gene_type:complete
MKPPGKDSRVSPGASSNGGAGLEEFSEINGQVDFAGWLQDGGSAARRISNGGTVAGSGGLVPGTGNRISEQRSIRCVQAGTFSTIPLLGPGWSVRSRYIFKL